MAFIKSLCTPFFLAIKACVWVLFLGLLTQLLAQELEVSSGFILDQWEMEDGLPTNSVVDIIQSDKGYLWLATFNGIVRFDGLRMKTYQTDNYPSMPSNRLGRIVQSRDGVFWFKSEQRYLVRLQNEHFEQVTSEQGLGSDFINYLKKDTSGTIWISTDSGIARYQQDELELFYPDQINFAVGWVFPLENGEVWFLDKSNQKVFRFANGELQEISEFTDNKKFLQSIISDTEGTVYIAIGDVIYSYQNDRLSVFAQKGNNGTESGYLGLDTKENIWVYTVENGVHALKNGQWSKLPESDHYRKITRPFFSVDEQDFWIVTEGSVWLNSEKILSVPNGIYRFIIDEEKSIWLATKADGLLRLKKNPFKTLTTSDGLPSNNVYGFLEDIEQTIWMGTHGFGSARYKGGKIESTIDVLSSSTGGYMKGFFQSKDSTIYAGSLGTGILEMKMTDKDFPASKYMGEQYPMDVNAYYEDQKGVLWIGARNGLFQFNSESFTHIQNYSGSNFAVRWFTPSPDSTTLWMATNGAGLLFHADDDVTAINKESGFPTNLIRSLYIEKGADKTEYTLWVGTQDIGLIRLPVRDGLPLLESLTLYGTSDGLLDHAIHVILEDDYQNFWFNTNRGIFRVAKEELENFHSGRNNSIQGVSFTERDGLLNREGNGGVQPSGIRASDGTFWMASQGGAVVFHPSELISDTFPNVVIEELSTSSREISTLKNELTLSNNERDFELTFSALSLKNPEKNDYKYRLVGYNETWQKPDILRKASYTNIPNGTYTFEVIASNYAGNWTPTPTSLTIIIEPYFYETIWFFFLCVSLFGLIMYSFIQWRLSTLRKNEIRLTELVNEKTKALQEEKKITEEQAARLQELDKAKTRFFVNISHELRTPLTLIIGPLKKILQSGNEFEEKTKVELDRMLRNSDRLLRLVDQTLELTRIEHGNVKLKISQLSLVSFIEDLVHVFDDVARNKQIELTLQTNLEDSEVFADEDKLEKIIANLLSNALKFTPPGGSISVDISQEENIYKIRVTDTGIGIPNKDLERVFERFYQVDSSETRDHEGSGIGLSLAKDFALLHAGDLEVESTPNVGSTFTVSLPAGSSHFKKEELLSLTTSFNGTDVQQPIQEQNKVALLRGDSEDQPTLLIVEDNPDMRGFLADLFATNFKVVTAFNGQEGLNQVQKTLPDLIIADIMMPVMDGFSFNRELKNDAQTAGIPLIFLTAKNQKESEIQGFQDGADAYIAKPFDPEILQNRVSNLLETRLRLRKLLKNEHSNEAPSEEAPSHPFLQRIQPIIETHYSDPDFKVKQLAEFLFMDRSQVLRNVKAASGLSPSEYLKKYRMEKAKSLMLRGEANISEVAYATGFNSLSYFSFSFKEFYQQAPSDFIRSLQS